MVSDNNVRATYTISKDTHANISAAAKKLNMSSSNFVNLVLGSICNSVIKADNTDDISDITSLFFNSMGNFFIGMSDLKK